MKTGKKLYTNPYIKIAGLLLLLVLFTGVSLFVFPTVADFSMERTRLVHVLCRIRLPELLIAVTAGAALGLAGALMQILLDNPLASPFTLGVSSASACGASFAIILGFTHGIVWLSTSLFALIFAMASIGLILALSSFMHISKKTIILVGMAVNFFFSSVNTLIQYYASPDAVYQIVFWSSGSLTNASLVDALRLFMVFAVCLFISLLFSNDMATIQQGERDALMKGVNVNAERRLFLLIASLLASFSVSIVGIIGFVGLVAPHLCRLLGLDSPKLLILSSGITGGLMLVLADALSKTLMHPTILPIGAITSLFGIGLLLVLMICKRRNSYEEVM